MFIPNPANPQHPQIVPMMQVQQMNSQVVAAVAVPANLAGQLPMVSAEATVPMDLEQEMKKRSRKSGSTVPHRPRRPVWTPDPPVASDSPLSASCALQASGAAPHPLASLENLWILPP